MKISIILNLNHSKYCVIVLLLACISCQNPGSEKIKQEIDSTRLSRSSITPSAQYAERLSIKKAPGYVHVTIDKPWYDAPKPLEYFLMPKDEKIPSNIEGKGTIIRTPVEKIVCLSPTHIGMVGLLNAEERIIAVPDKDKLFNQKIDELVGEDKIKEVGNYNILDTEVLVQLNPDLIFDTTAGTAHDNFAKLRELGLTVVTIPGYMEPHPLGRLEWVKFMGLCLGKEKLAREEFQRISEKYNKLAEKAATAENEPRVMAGHASKDSWSAPAGNSYFAQYLSDAGANYLFDVSEGLGNQKLSLEYIFDKSTQAEFWINPGSNLISLEQIKDQDSRLTELPPAKKGKVFNYNKQLNQAGRNNYWEQGYSQPHVVLADLIKIFHPELMPSHELVYFRELD